MDAARRHSLFRSLGQLKEIMTLYSIGHSTHPQSDFLAMLGGHISTVIDARSHPSSKWEWFWKSSMEKWLPAAGVGYEWWPGLGGWSKAHAPHLEEMAKHGVDLSPYLGKGFPKGHIAKGEPEPTETDVRQEFLPCVRPTWTNRGLLDYSWFMTLDEFLADCDKLIGRGKTEDLGFMCCECQWWRCHRSMIADYLWFLGIETHHIMPRIRQKNRIKFIDGQKIVLHSQVVGNRVSRYDPEILKRWESWRDRAGNSRALI